MPPLFEEGDEYVPPVDADPPTAFDWRTYLGSDWLSPVKNQGVCGSCWAFSAVGVTEAAHNIANNNPNLDLDLSEQYLVADCSSAGTCCGGYKDTALQYIRDSGVPDEACMSYVDGSGCSCDGGTCDSICTYNTGNNPEDSCSDRTCSNRCGDWSSRLTTHSKHRLRGIRIHRPSSRRSWIRVPWRFPWGTVMLLAAIGTGTSIAARVIPERTTR